MPEQCGRGDKMMVIEGGNRNNMLISKGTPPASPLQIIDKPLTKHCRLTHHPTTPPSHHPTPHQRRERRENLIGTLIAVLGTGLAVSQILDSTAAAALLDWSQQGAALSATSSQRLVELSIQLIPLLVAIMVMVWVYCRKNH